MARLSYNPALDGVRALAVLGVLCCHLDLLSGGYIGVDVFMVLSGFLITALMLAERAATGTISIRDFYLRRALRLLPAFLLYVAVGAVMAWLKASPAQREAFAGNALSAIFYVNNYYRVAHPNGGGAWFGHVWSLSIEEQFYLLWPPCLIALAPRKHMLSWILGAILVLTGWRALLALHEATHARIYFALDTRADALLIGCALGVLRERGYPRVAKLGLPALLGLFAIAFSAPELTSRLTWLDRGGDSLVALLAALVLLSIDRAEAWTRVLAPLAPLGRVSYGFYLWHYPVSAIVLAKLMPRVGVAASLLIATAATLAVAALSFRFVEQPIQRLKRRQPNALDSVSTPARRSSGTIS